MPITLVLYAGIALTLLGLAGLVLSILRVAAARRELAGDDEALRARLQAIVPLNLGALLTSALGLMMVMVALLLG